MNKGKVLITGGTSGLGYELVKLLQSEGYEVFATGRNSAILENLPGDIHFIKIDFSDLNSISRNIRQLFDRGIRFDLVINNAGILTPSEFTTSVNGIEYSFQVNFLSHFLINDLIISNKNHSDPLTIVSVTSPVYKYVKADFIKPVPEVYRSFKTYSESKYYMLLIGEFLLKKYPEKNVKFIGFNPGTFSSGIYRMQKSWFKMMYRVAAPFMRSPVRVAHLLTDILKEGNHENGAVYMRKNRFRRPQVADKEKTDKFMTKCYEIVEPFIR